MNNKLFIPLVLAALATALIGCGEGEEGIFGSANNNELEINNFERVNNNIARIKTEYSNGERDIDVTNVKGSFDSSNINNLPVSTVLANSFEGTLEDRYIKVDGRTITRPIYTKNSNERFDYKVTYRTLDLSNKNAKSYQRGNRPIDDRGIFTDLNNYINIPNNISFPSGSVCYVPVIDSDRNFFSFNDKNKTRYRTLNDWIEANEKRFGSNQRVETTVPINIGINNEYRAAKVRFPATNDRIEYNYYGSEFEQNIFDVNFVDKDQARPNEDSFRGVIDCTLVNDTAADFLEIEIRKAY